MASLTLEVIKSVDLIDQFQSNMYVHEIIKRNKLKYLVGSIVVSAVLSMVLQENLVVSGVHEAGTIALFVGFQVFRELSHVVFHRRDFSKLWAVADAIHRDDRLKLAVYSYQRHPAQDVELNYDICSCIDEYRILQGFLTRASLQFRQLLSVAQAPSSRGNWAQLSLAFAELREEMQTHFVWITGVIKKCDQLEAATEARSLRTRDA
ncbi:hypothetical protein C1H76_4608 [Elsinoe australis]|uniref:Uncharacterized protein n=1 Tax=Elsinoe australis TaxID=40998 RepID=A0A4U7B342_9PEZI|nr:hypothetical protein C1H76_4608 [Elsinoe australis]